MFSLMLGARLGISKGERVPHERVVEAQTTGGECCKRYDLKVHIPAEEWSPGAFVRQIQWKNTAGITTHIPIRFSVEYCAGLTLSGPCSSYNGEITIDGVLQELGGSNGGTGSWPRPDCGINAGKCGLDNHDCRLVEFEEPPINHWISGFDCAYDPDRSSQNPPVICFIDTDYRLTIAEKITLGQTKRFKRIWLNQDPDADPNTGSPPRLIQRWDPSVPGDPNRFQCGPDQDQYVMIIRPTQAIYFSQFEPVTSEDDPWSSECHVEAEACFANRFYPLQ